MAFKFDHFGTLCTYSTNKQFSIYSILFSLLTVIQLAVPENVSHLNWGYTEKYGNDIVFFVIFESIIHGNYAALHERIASKVRHKNEKFQIIMRNLSIYF